MLFKVVVPIPPLEIGNVPDAVLLTFKFVNRDASPEKLDAYKILFVLSHVKLPDCEIDVAAFPISN